MNVTWPAVAMLATPFIGIALILWPIAWAATRMNSKDGDEQ